MLLLTVIKQGSSSQSSLPAVKVERTPIQIVKMETFSRATDLGNHRRMELDPPCGQVITGSDEAYSDVASEVDDEYSHEKVRKYPVVPPCTLLTIV